MSEFHSNSEKHARAYLIARQIPLPETPHEIPHLDFGTLPEMDSKELTSLLGRIAQWLDYIESESAIADVNRTAAEAMLDKVSDETLVRLRSLDKYASSKVTELKAQADIDGSVISARRTAQEAGAVYKLLSARVKGLAQLYNAVSREITRRGMAGERPSANPLSSEDRTPSWSRS